MNLADPELEFIDPTPNVHSLFIHFDILFFSAKLADKVVVRWSKRMYSCAGVCSYECTRGICDIALSEPLLKLRPRKDMVETLLHEMIHAFLFVTGLDQCRDGHGPNFLSLMYSINRAAGLNISVYHNFHNEVKLYQNHVWRCNGPCQMMRPYFGVVRRSMNRAPGPSDFWWNTHRIVCGGTFIKCSEPEKPRKQPSKKTTPTPNVNIITKYILNEQQTKNKYVKNPIPNPTIFSGSGIVSGQNRFSSVSVEEAVRNVWANKTLNSFTTPVTKTNKRSSNVPDALTPPKKVARIDDYFKTTASTILKDVYGKDFIVTQSSDTNKLKAVPAKETLIECPICNAKISDVQINSHIDECLNKDVIEKLSKEAKPPKTTSPNEINNVIDITAVPFTPIFKPLSKDSVKVKPPDSQSTNKSIIKPEKVEEYISSSSKIKTESITNNYIDLTTVEIETRTSPDVIDLTSDMNPFKAEPSTSKDTMCPCCGKKIDKPVQEHINECLKFFDNNTTIPEEASTSLGDRTIVIDDSDDCNYLTNPTLVKTEPGTSKGVETCPCCDKKIDKPVQEHLDECLSFFDNNSTTPEEGTSFGDRTIVIDDSDDEFDETQTLNATGTKTPCPCCMKMLEVADMNNHLDVCLAL